MVNNQAYWCIAVLVQTVVVSVSGMLNVMPRNTTVLIGDSTYFNCSTTMSLNDAQFRWTLNKEGEDDIIYGAGKIYDAFKEKFSVEINEATGSYNLVILNVTKQDAGIYRCHDLDIKATAHLIVLESKPICRSSMHRDGVIGPNSCKMDPEEIHLSCSAAYYMGNVQPKLRWVKGNDTTSITDGLSCKNVNNSINCTLTIRANLSLQGLPFVCQIEEAASVQYACEVKPVKVLYAVDSMQMEVVSRGETVNCIAKSNQPCKYRWEWSESNDMSIVTVYGASFASNRSGMYACKAECDLGGKNCTVSATMVKIVTTSDQGAVGDSCVPGSMGQMQTYNIVSFVLWGLLVLSIGVYCIWNKQKKRKKAQAASRVQYQDQNQKKEQPQNEEITQLTKTE